VSKTAVVDRGARQAPAHSFKRWLFAGLEVKATQGPHTEEKEIEHPWWKVMCLTGVDFRADVDAQGGAYATGVLVLMASAAVAVTLSVAGCSSSKGYLLRLGNARVCLHDLGQRY
jgi:hypothetical protein